MIPAPFLPLLPIHDLGLSPQMRLPPRSSSFPSLPQEQLLVLVSMLVKLRKQGGRSHNLSRKDGDLFLFRLLGWFISYLRWCSDDRLNVALWGFSRFCVNFLLWNLSSCSNHLCEPSCLNSLIETFLYWVCLICFCCWLLWSRSRWFLYTCSSSSSSRCICLLIGRQSSLGTNDILLLFLRCWLCFGDNRRGWSCPDYRLLRISRLCGHY